MGCLNTLFSKERIHMPCEMHRWRAINSNAYLIWSLEKKTCFYCTNSFSFHFSGCNFWSSSSLCYMCQSVMFRRRKIISFLSVSIQKSRSENCTDIIWLLMNMQVRSPAWTSQHARQQSNDLNQRLKLHESVGPRFRNEWRSYFSREMWKPAGPSATESKCIHRVRSHNGKGLCLYCYWFS